MKDLSTYVFSRVVIDQAFDHDPGLQDFFNQLTITCPEPLELAGVNAFVNGVRLAAESAAAVLACPNQTCLQLRANINRLQSAVSDVYINQGMEDVQQRVLRGLRAYPAWRILSYLGRLHNINDTNTRARLIGVELMVSLHEKRKMSPAFCDQIRNDQRLDDLGTSALDQIIAGNFEDRPEWLTRHKNQRSKFFGLFDSDPIADEYVEDFQSKVQSHMVSNSHLPCSGKREAVLTRHGLSHRQLDDLTALCSRDRDISTMFWLAAFSGLPLREISNISVEDSGTESKVISIDLEAGVLIRDMSCLVQDAPRRSASQDSPASYRLRLPIPSHVHAHLLALNKNTSAFELGNLLPALRSLQSTASVVSSSSAFSPSMAKIKNSVGVHLRQRGMDDLHVALLTGDLGHTARSKLHYCLLTHEEIFRATSAAYKFLGLGEPVSQNDLHVPFGTSFAPLMEHIKACNAHLCQQVESLRPGRNSKDFFRLVDFHNAYAHLVGFRIQVGLALRNSKCIPLPTRTVELLADKQVGGLAGGMPVVTSSCILEQVDLFNAHRIAMSDRVESHRPQNGYVDFRLSKYIEILSHDKQQMLKPLSSTEIVRNLKSIANLRPDFGRKLMENSLRHADFKAHDINRFLRHEILGQEALSSTSDESHSLWASRMTPRLDKLLIEILGQPIKGLRGETA